MKRMTQEDLAANLGVTRQTIHAVEKGKFHIDCGLRMLRLNDSIANMSVISPQHFREFALPYFQEAVDVARVPINA